MRGTLDEARKGERGAQRNDWRRRCCAGSIANKMQQPDLDTVNDILLVIPMAHKPSTARRMMEAAETPKAAHPSRKPLSEPTPLHPDRTSTIAAVRRGDLTPEDRQRRIRR